MKNWPALAVTAGLVATGLTTTEAAAALPDPAPTNVQIGWKDDTFQFIHVTWEEDSPQPNKIVARRQGGTPVAQVMYVAADDPNEVDLRADLVDLDIPVMEIGVAVGTEAGETSPVAVSKPFDTIDPQPPSLVSFTMSGSSTLAVKWRAGSPFEIDTTPADPLDGSAPVLFTPQYTLPERTVELAKPSAATELTFTGPMPPFTFQVSAQNEWGTRGAGSRVYAQRGGLTAKIPTWVVASSAQAKITGTFASPKAQIVLQARNSSTSPWYVVASQTCYDGKYEFDLGAAGSRQYRVAMPNTPVDHFAYFGGYSPIVSTTVQISPYSAFFSNATIRRGESGQARLYMSPSIVGKAILQRWNGKTWITVGSVAIANGMGVGYVRSTTPGRVAYRYYVPSATLKGLSYAAAYSRTFVLTTI